MILERLVFAKLPDAWSLLGAAIIVGGAVKVALEKSKSFSSTTKEGRNKDAEGEERKAEEGRLGRVEELAEEVDGDGELRPLATAGVER
jgi:hypothetical protein